MRTITAQFIERDDKPIYNIEGKLARVFEHLLHCGHNGTTILYAAQSDSLTHFDQYLSKLIKKYGINIRKTRVKKSGRDGEVRFLNYTLNEQVAILSTGTEN